MRAPQEDVVKQSFNNHFMRPIEICNRFVPGHPLGPIKLYLQRDKSLYAFEEKQTDIHLATPRPQDKQSIERYLTWHSVLWHLLTGQSIDQRRPLIIIFLLGDRAVLPVHLTDWGGAFPGNLATVVFIKKHLIHQVRLYQVGLRGRLRGPIVVALQSQGWEEQRDEFTCENKLIWQKKVKSLPINCTISTVCMLSKRRNHNLGSSTVSNITPIHRI